MAHHEMTKDRKAFLICTKDMLLPNGTTALGKGNLTELSHSPELGPEAEIVMEPSPPVYPLVIPEARCCCTQAMLSLALQGKGAF